MGTGAAARSTVQGAGPLELSFIRGDVLIVTHRPGQAGERWRGAAAVASFLAGRFD
eukprot:COSAG01_NODE_9837_length_2327_cov_1.171903_3_plen_56_part_00